MADKEIRYAAGTISAALANGERLLSVNPAAAALQARTLIKNGPDDAAALRLLARALDRLDERAEAAKARIEAIRRSRSVPVLAAGIRALDGGDPASVITSLCEHIRHFPDDPVAHLLLGEAQMRLNHSVQAITSLTEATRLAPEYPEAFLALAQAQYQRFDPDAALAALASALKAAPDHMILQRFQATLLDELFEHEAANRIRQSLCQRFPDEVALHIEMGDGLRTLGRREEAVAAYRLAIGRSPPGVGQAWWSLANIAPGNLTDAELADLTSRAFAPNGGDDRRYFHFAAGVAWDHRGDYEQAFKHLTVGNAIHRSRLDFDSEAFAARMASVSSVFDASFFAKRHDWGIDDQAPIFIVGMPRSGSTLVEQILACHSEIEACGEMPIVPSLLREYAETSGFDKDRDFPKLLGSINRNISRDLGNEYIRRSQFRRKKNMHRFIDKLPHNWAELAFISLILPKAAIIDVRRDPLDCAISNFSLLFSPGHPASYDLGEFAEYYRSYTAAMTAFKTARPDATHCLSYEGLLDEPMGAVQHLLEFLNLPFEAGCLEFHRSVGAIATSSAEQVRRPLNRDGVGRWLRYKQWVPELPRMFAPRE